MLIQRFLDCVIKDLGLQTVFFLVPTDRGNTMLCSSFKWRTLALRFLGFYVSRILYSHHPSFLGSYIFYISSFHFWNTTYIPRTLGLLGVLALQEKKNPYIFRTYVSVRCCFNPIYPQGSWEHRALEICWKYISDSWSPWPQGPTVYFHGPLFPYSFFKGSAKVYLIIKDLLFYSRRDDP